MGASPFCSWDRCLSSYPSVHCRQQPQPGEDVTLSSTDESGGRRGAREPFHLPGRLLEALEAYVRASRPPTSKSAVMRLALEEFLEREGAKGAREGGR